MLKYVLLCGGLVCSVANGLGDDQERASPLVASLLSLPVDVLRQFVGESTDQEAVRSCFLVDGEGQGINAALIKMVESRAISDRKATSGEDFYMVKVEGLILTAQRIEIKGTRTKNLFVGQGFRIVYDRDSSQKTHGWRLVEKEFDPWKELGHL